MEIKATANQIKIKANTIFKIVGIFLFAMIGVVVYTLLSLDDYSIDGPLDVLGVIVLCVWFTALLVLACFAFLTGCKTVTIDETGVVCQMLCFKKALTWAEIKDYGASYSGQTRWDGNTYIIYFAAKEQKTKSDCKKKLKGSMIKTYVVGDAYGDVTQKIFPFCRNFTEVRPFAAEDRFHWI